MKTTPETSRVVVPFEVVGWDETPYHDDENGPRLSRATVKKSFRGDLVGESVAELLMCQAAPPDLSAGAGYVASEVVNGRLLGRSGSFVLQHSGLVDASGSRTFGHVVPGSGTGELAGLSGEVEIAVDSDGAHTLILDCRFG